MHNLIIKNRIFQFQEPTRGLADITKNHGLIYVGQREALRQFKIYSVKFIYHTILTDLDLPVTFEEVASVCAGTLTIHNTEAGREQPYGYVKALRVAVKYLIRMLETQKFELSKTHADMFAWCLQKVNPKQQSVYCESSQKQLQIDFENLCNVLSSVLKNLHK